MKTKFIEGTNKQYSIREEGKVISHKKSGDKVLKIVKGQVSLSVHGVSTNVFISYLLKQYFNYFMCKSCNTKVKGNEKKRSLCVKCKVTVKESNARYFKTLSPLSKQKRRKYKRESRLKLKDFYIREKLNVSNIPISKELIQAKRQQLLLHRELKKKNHE